MDILKYNDFISEAHISIDRIQSGIEYTLNKSGIDKLNLIYPNIKWVDVVLSPITYDILPSNIIKKEGLKKEDNVLYLRGSVIKLVKIGDIDLDKVGIYLSSNNFYFFIEYSNVLTIKKNIQSGSSKRANYGSELAFCLQLQRSIKDIKGIDIPVYEGLDLLSNKEQNDLFLESWYDNHKEMYIDLLPEQCDYLVGILGSSIKKLTKIVNGNPSYPINKKFMEINKESKLGFSNKDKWNPSDIWLIMNNYNDSDMDKFEDIPDINNFLKESILKKSGMIGISLKLPIKTDAIGIEYKNVLEDSRETNYEFEHYHISTGGTVYLDYSYIKEKTKIHSTIEFRVFGGEKKPDDKIQAEIKTSSKQIGGKSSITSFMDTDNKVRFERLRRLMRYESVKSVIKEIDKEIVLSNKVSRVLLDDIKDTLIHTDEPNMLNYKEKSKIQGLYFLYLIDQYDNSVEVLEELVKRAKSLSDISAPYILVK